MKTQTAAPVPSSAVVVISPQLETLIRTQCRALVARCGLEPVRRQLGLSRDSLQSVIGNLVVRRNTLVATGFALGLLAPAAPLAPLALSSLPSFGEAAK